MLLLLPRVVCLHKQFSVAVLGCAHAGWRCFCRVLRESPWQTLELIQVEVFYTFPRPVGFVEERETGGNACIGFESVDVQVGVQDFKAVMFDQLGQHGFQADNVQRIALVIDRAVQELGACGFLRGLTAGKQEGKSGGPPGLEPGTRRL